MVEAFSEWERTDPATARHGEPLSTFLDRVDQPLFARVRILINEWLSHLPDEAAVDVVARLTSPLNHAFRAAFWELYVHELLRRCGNSVEIHPTLSGTLKVPDYRATMGDSSVIVEVTAVGDSDPGPDARLNRFYDELNKTDSPNFFLWVDIPEVAASTPALGAVRSDLEAWLAGLSPDAIHRAMSRDGIAAMPQRDWQLEGWHLSVGAYPKATSARGIPGVRPVGIYGGGGGAQTIDDKKPLLRRLRRKSSRYGSFDEPYVIAVSGSSFTTDETDIVDALFGTDIVTVASPASGGPPAVHPSPHADGLFVHGGKIGTTQVSAVLAVPYLEPWEVARKVPSLVHHPAPNHALTTECPYLRIGSADEDGQLVWTPPSRPIHELFDLPEEWPGPEPAFVDSP